MTSTAMIRPFNRLKNRKPPSIILTLAVLFILITTGAIFHGYKQFLNSLEKASLSDGIVAQMTGMVVHNYGEATIKILESYASRPLFINSVKGQDLAAMHLHLADLKKNNEEVDLAFVTDEEGLILANYPVSSEAMGHSLAYRDWYKGVSAHWVPYVSTVFRLIVGEKPLAVAVAVPIFDANGEVIGVLANSHQLSTLDKLFKSLHAGLDKRINLLDQSGHLIYDSKNSAFDRITVYTYYAEVKEALGGGKTQLEIIDPNNNREKKYLAVASTELGWTVVVERSLREMLRSEYGRFSRIAAIAVLLFLLISAFILYQNSLHGKTLALLQLERQLRQSEKRYKNLIDNIPEILYSFSGRHADIYCSPQISLVLGCTPEYLSSNPTLWYESIHPDHLPAVNQAIHDAKNGGKIELEYQIHDIHGRSRWLADHMTSTADENGETVITGIARDITDSKTAEEALRKSREKYRSLVENMLDGFAYCRMLYDDEGRPVDFLYLEVNDAFARLTGIQKVVGKKFSELYPACEGREDLLARYSRVAMTGHSEKFEFFFQPLSLWLDLSVASHEKGYILVVFNDITTRRRMENALRESEARLTTAAGIAKFGVYSYDFAGGQGFYSPEFLALFGLPPGTQLELDEDRMAKALHPEDKPGFLARVKAAVDPCGPGALEHEYRIIRTDGEVRWLRVIGRTVFSGNGPEARPLQANGIIHDITELKRAEEELRILNHELERRVERRTRELQETQAHFLHAEKLSAIGKLSASIAHEFNSPLQAVMTVLKGLKLSDCLEKEDKKLLQAAIEESERMKGLIRSLQDFNRPSSGKKILMDVHASIDSILLLCKSDFNRKRISTELRYVERLPQILAIPDQIKQVFLNLLNNAADAFLDRGGVITITTCHDERLVAVAITDTGTGIPPEKVGLIFQPFYTTKPEVKGTGLGLSVCHGIVQNHHGEIRVDSRPGKGSTFTVLLPISEE